MSADPSRPLDVLVVGCGSIAGGFDAERNATLPPLTHAGAFTRHGGFRLAACVDPDDVRRHAFMQRWAVPVGAASIPALAVAPGRFDVVSICSPTVRHAADLEAVLALTPRLVFCEKPVTPSLVDTERWVARFATAGIPLAVNHTRRWAPDVEQLARELACGAWGELRSVCAQYNKGVLNNGGHIIDLLQILVGPLEVTAAGAPVWDFWEDDPSIPGLLRTAAGRPVQLNVAHAADYALFELQLLTERGVVAMEDGGHSWRLRRVVESDTFKGYRCLGAAEEVAGSYPLAMSRAAANIHGAVSRLEVLASTGITALAAQRVCETLRTLALAATPQTPR